VAKKRSRASDGSGALSVYSNFWSSMAVLRINWAVGVGKSHSIDAIIEEVIRSD